MKTMRITKAMQASRDAMKAAILACMERHGAKPDPRTWLSDRYVLDTPAGPLELSPDEWGWHMYFECSEAAFRFTGSRNGKWNYTCYGDWGMPIETVLQYLEYCFRKIESFVPTDADRASMARQLAERDRREAHWAVCNEVRDKAEVDGLWWGVASGDGRYLMPDGDYVADSYLTCQRFASEAEAATAGGDIGRPFKVV